MFRRLARVRCTKRRRLSQGSRSRIVRLPTVLRLGVRFQVSQFSSVLVRQVRVARVRHCVRVSVGRCIPRVPVLQAHVRWELDQACRLREHQPVRAAVRVVQPAGQVNVTFLAA